MEKEEEGEKGKRRGAGGGGGGAGLMNARRAAAGGRSFNDGGKRRGGREVLGDDANSAKVCNIVDEVLGGTRHVESVRKETGRAVVQRTK